MELFMYHIFALLMAAFLLYVIFRVHKSQVGRLTKILIQILSGGLLGAIMLML